MISAKWLLHFDGCLRSLKGTLHLQTPSMQDRPQILNRCGNMRVVLFSATRCRSGKELPCLLLHSNCQTRTLGPLWARSQAALMTLILPDKQEMASKQPAIMNEEFISLTRCAGKQTSLIVLYTFFVHLQLQRASYILCKTQLNNIEQLSVLFPFIIPLFPACGQLCNINSHPAPSPI